MDIKQWYAHILREANAFIEPREAELKAGLEREGDLRDFLPQIERHIAEYLARTDDLIDLIRFSGLEVKDPDLWRAANDWDGVLFRVAYACLTHDLTVGVLKVLAGELPRVAPGQVAP